MPSVPQMWRSSVGQHSTFSLAMNLGGAGGEAVWRQVRVALGGGDRAVAQPLLGFAERPGAPETGGLGGRAHHQVARAGVAEIVKADAPVDARALERAGQPRVVALAMASLKTVVVLGGAGGEHQCGTDAAGDLPPL